ncbi:hypothetical protein GWK47_016027 [Chionoecetes opilio]|uniref:Uncharacterized protein n=1 Tax=Chionoecetes opilio TaxID=41210 RepID=A0A8J4XWU1_CHIOP|nr:hypothetical protein GWK47_016027 [Chionoecetes opilio]
MDLHSVHHIFDGMGEHVWGAWSDPKVVCEVQAFTTAQLVCVHGRKCFAVYMRQRLVDVRSRTRRVKNNNIGTESGAGRENYHANRTSLSRRRSRCAREDLRLFSRTTTRGRDLKVLESIEIERASLHGYSR